MHLGLWHALDVPPPSLRLLASPVPWPSLPAPRLALLASLVRLALLALLVPLVLARLVSLVPLLLAPLALPPLPARLSRSLSSPFVVFGLPLWSVTKWGPTLLRRAALLGMRALRLFGALLFLILHARTDF